MSPAVPRRPELPPARDPTRPRPFKHIETAALMQTLTEMSVDIAEKHEVLQGLRTLRVEYFRELERRDVSLRAMADACKISNVAISRILRRHDLRLKPPPV